MRLLLIVTLVAATCLSQDTSKLQNAKVIRLQYTTTRQVMDLISFAKQSVYIGYSQSGQDVITLSGPPDAVAVVENLIKEIDRPPAPTKSIEVAAYILLGGDQAGDKLPDELSPVVKQLKGVFPLAHYQLAGTALWRGLAGKKGQMSGQVQFPPNGQAGRFLLSFTPTIVDGANATSINLSPLGLNVQVPHRIAEGGYTFHDAVINTDVALKVGQKVVIGSNSIGRNTDTLFLVMTSRVLD